MADCHQKLGSADAQQVYQRILRDFADQNDAVVEAKLRLAALGGASSGTAGRSYATAVGQRDRSVGIGER